MTTTHPLPAQILATRTDPADPSAGLAAILPAANHSPPPPRAPRP
jgi:hypothetical protein